MKEIKVISLKGLIAYPQRLSIAAVGELTNCPPGTEAKLITKSRS